MTCQPDLRNLTDPAQHRNWRRIATIAHRWDGCVGGFMDLGRSQIRAENEGRVRILGPSNQGFVEIRGTFQSFLPSYFTESITPKYKILEDLGISEFGKGIPV